VIRRVAAAIQDRTAISGFFTEEVRVDGKRQGFRGVSFDSRVFPLAGRRIAGPLRIGGYGVDLSGLETIGLAALAPAPGTRLVIVDEVGKMELLSERFRQRIEALLDADVAVLGTIALHGVGVVKRLRHDPRITLLRLRPEARDGMVGEIVRRLVAAGVVPRERSESRSS
jgi:nucleoside-triphosphatase